MNYEHIWQKTLGVGETVEYEFSVGDRYRKFGIIVWAVICLPLVFAAGVGIVLFLIMLFYFGYYLKVANAYAFTNKQVLIHRGWLTTSTTSIDYAKITDVHVKEPFFDRLITHTGNLSINTAGTNVREVVLLHVESPYEIKKKLDSLRNPS